MLGLLWTLLFVIIFHSNVIRPETEREITDVEVASPDGSYQQQMEPRVYGFSGTDNDRENSNFPYFSPVSSHQPTIPSYDLPIAPSSNDRISIATDEQSPAEFDLAQLNSGDDGEIRSLEGALGRTLLNKKPYGVKDLIANEDEFFNPFLEILVEILPSIKSGALDQVLGKKFLSDMIPALLLKKLLLFPLLITGIGKILLQLLLESTMPEPDLIQVPYKGQSHANYIPPTLENYKPPAYLGFGPYKKPYLKPTLYPPKPYRRPLNFVRKGQFVK